MENGLAVAACLMKESLAFLQCLHLWKRTVELLSRLLPAGFEEIYACVELVFVVFPSHFSLSHLFFEVLLIKSTGSRQAWSLLGKGGMVVVERSCIQMGAQGVLKRSGK